MGFLTHMRRLEVLFSMDFQSLGKGKVSCLSSGMRVCWTPFTLSHYFLQNPFCDLWWTYLRWLSLDHTWSIYSKTLYFFRSSGSHQLAKCSFRWRHLHVVLYQNLRKESWRGFLQISQLWFLDSEWENCTWSQFDGLQSLHCHVEIRRWHFLVFSCL